MKRHHAVITGTGRSGTTFLVQLLSRLGLDTGYQQDATNEQEYHAGSRAGLERDIRDNDAPYIVKNPWFCDYADEVFQNPDIEVDHIFVPMRDFAAAAESRRHVERTERSSLPLRSRIKHLFKPLQVKGGLWHTESRKRGQQEFLLLSQLHNLLLSTAAVDVPVTFMKFPTIVKDPEYLYRKLSPILGDYTYEQFLQAFNDTANPKLVHTFTPEDK